MALKERLKGMLHIIFLSDTRLIPLSHHLCHTKSVWQWQRLQAVSCSGARFIPQFHGLPLKIGGNNPWWCHQGYFQLCLRTQLKQSTDRKSVLIINESCESFQNYFQKSKGRTISRLTKRNISTKMKMINSSACMQKTPFIVYWK